MFVIDASVVIELFLNTFRASKLRQRLFENDRSFFAPHLIDIEVTQTLRRFVYKREMSSERAQLSLGDFAALPLQRYAHTSFIPRIWELRDSLSAYDATYVALAEALEMPLLTCDEKLARANGHRAKVEVAG
jgi:predicted nucleic acid-binding protein